MPLPETGNTKASGLVSAASRLIVAIAVATAFIMMAPGVARASESAWVGDPQIGEARLVSAVTATGDLDTLPLGIEFTLAAGWKIYWRTPGEAGLAPVIDLSAGPNPDLAGRISWPLPQRFDAFGFDNFGYANAVILPLELSGHEAGMPIQVIADLEALVCSDICVPFGGRLEMTLPDGAANPSPHAKAMAQFAAMVPRRADGEGTSASGPSLRPLRLEARPDGLVVELAEGAPPVADVFVEAQDDVAFKAPVPLGDGLFLEAVPADKLVFDSTPVTLTISAPPEMGEFRMVVTTPADRATVQQNSPRDRLGLSWRIIALALLGGLILNLMPCVLPVLALKLAAVLDAAGAPRRELRLRFLAGAAGILTSFVGLAGALALLRLAGGTIGWGIQFQNPVFLLVMILVLGIFALSLLDLVMIPIPRAAQRLAGVGQGGGFGQGGGHSYRGDFMAGMLATVLATPCSAPFVGTAVAVALSGSMLDLFGIFIALGLGLAAPWIVVAAQPSLVGFLPRPGPWMPWLKRGLALLLLGTMIWLGSVLMALLGPNAPSTVATADARWGVWSQQAVSDSLDGGRPVFVDVTADWCVTCKANKALVLDRQPVSSVMAEAAAANRLTLLRADWTRPDADIAAFLASHGRYGIPFNIILRPGAAPPIILPELLRDMAVLTALENAGVTAK
ncbi:MAG: protein-disulfide reductase DsbD domain-containing protein [Rhodobiaceae bacterium]